MPTIYLPLTKASLSGYYAHLKTDAAVSRIISCMSKEEKKNALICSQDGNNFWTTQNQFWQWVRERTVVKTGDAPLSGRFVRENEEYTVVISNTVLNIKHPNHLQEALSSRRKALL